MTVQTRMRIGQDQWLTLRRAVAPSFRGIDRAEMGAVGLLGQVSNKQGTEYLVSEIVWPEAGDIEEAHGQGIVFSAAYLRRVHLAMRKYKLAGLVTFHTHPYADDVVSFSRYDNQQDPQLVTNLQDLEPGTRLISVVLGKNSQCGRLWESPVGPYPLDTLVVVGEDLNYLKLDGTPSAEPPSAAAAFDRALALTGTGALAQLAELHVAVVGGSGTGSLMVELLNRAGCKRITVVDPETVEEVNLNRILHASQEDADVGNAKVDVLRRGVEASGLGCQVDTIQGSVLDADVLAELKATDVIFGCLDQALPRRLLSELAFRYLRPYVDVGSEIGSDATGETIYSLNARATYVAPGRRCLVCAGLVTARQLRFESLTYEERQREIAQGYSKDLVMTQPAVMELNMRAASLGLLIFRHLLQPFMESPLPMTFLEDIVTYSSRRVKESHAADPACPICRTNPRRGYGDCGGQIGFNAAFVEKLSRPPKSVA